MSTRTFVVYVEDKPGVLNRVASLFRRRNFNIDSLNVGKTHEPGVSRMTVVLEADAEKSARIEANLYKMVNVLWVHDITDVPTLDRVLALVKVRATPEQRSEILQICQVFRARAVDMSLDSLSMEITGPKDKIKGLMKVLKPYGIIEMVQTGIVSMVRGSEERDMTHPTTNATPTKVA